MRWLGLEEKLKQAILRLLSLAILSSMLVGCVTIPRYDVRIDSINSGTSSGRKYYLFPGKKGVSASDLQFKEFATYTHRALQYKGFIPASGLNEADVAVFLYYDVSDPSERQYTYSTPIFGQTGVSSSRTYGSLYSYGNSATYSGTTTYTPTYGVVGSSQHSGTYVSFTRYISLNALDLDAYRANHEERQVWKTDIFSSGSSGDLRKAFPVMIAAAMRYIGENTGQQIKVSLYEDDRRAEAVKGQTMTGSQSLSLEERRALRDQQRKVGSPKRESPTLKSTTLSPEGAPSGPTSTPQ